MEQQVETTEIPNVFAEKKQKNYDYKQLPKGQRLMGIVGIKAFDKMWEGKTVPSYRIIFRDKEIPDAFGNVSFGAATKAGSKLRTFVEECTGKAFAEKYVDGKVMHKTLTSLLGKWFEVTVKHKPNPKDEAKPYVNLISFEAIASSGIDAVAYFKDIPVTEKVEEDDDLPWS